MSNGHWRSQWHTEKMSVGSIYSPYPYELPLMSQAEPWTVGRLLQWTTDYLKQHGSETPRLDAEVLLATALGCQRIQLYATFGDEPAEPARKSFRELVKRRAEGAPVAYLVGQREFYSLPFRVTPDVLIPRPETEFVVVRLLDLVKERSAGGEKDVVVADVGTGSGIIAVCAAKHCGCRVVAIDISPTALEVARSNAKALGVAGEIEFLQGDLLVGLPTQPTFDVIASNPPYISTAEMAELAKDVREFEPKLALEAGEHGTEVIERLIPQAAERLKAGGSLLMEISPMLDAKIRGLLEQDGRFEVRPTTKDLAGHPRVVEARRKA
jgi:release factor glutamine methyltransferase